MESLSNFLGESEQMVTHPTPQPSARYPDGLIWLYAARLTTNYFRLHPAIAEHDAANSFAWGGAWIACVRDKGLV